MTIIFAPLLNIRLMAEFDRKASRSVTPKGRKMTLSISIV